MTERTILITGATSGLGYGLARALSTSPGRLILHGRDRGKLEEFRTDLAGAAAIIDTVHADLADLSQVRGLARQVADMADHLSVLVNNAGIGMGATDRREVSADGNELRLAVNHLAPFALSLACCPCCAPARPAGLSMWPRAPSNRSTAPTYNWNRVTPVPAPTPRASLR